MNPIIKTLKELNVNEQSIKELFETLTTNPMMAMSILGKFNLPQEKVQEIMKQVMLNPSLIKEAVEELGLDFSAVEKAQEALKNNTK